MYNLTIPKARDFIANDLQLAHPPTEEEVRLWCTAGVNGQFLPHIRIADRILISPGDVEVFLDVLGETTMRWTRRPGPSGRSLEEVCKDLTQEFRDSGLTVIEPTYQTGQSERDSLQVNFLRNRRTDSKPISDGD